MRSGDCHCSISLSILFLLPWREGITDKPGSVSCANPSGWIIILDCVIHVSVCKCKWTLGRYAPLGRFRGESLAREGSSDHARLEEAIGSRLVIFISRYITELQCLPSGSFGLHCTSVSSWTTEYLRFPPTEESRWAYCNSHRHQVTQGHSHVSFDATSVSIELVSKQGDHLAFSSISIIRGF